MAVPNKVPLHVYFVPLILGRRRFTTGYESTCFQSRVRLMSGEHGSTAKVDSTRPQPDKNGLSLLAQASRETTKQGGSDSVIALSLTLSAMHTYRVRSYCFIFRGQQARIAFRPPLRRSCSASGRIRSEKFTGLHQRPVCHSQPFAF